MIGEIKMVPGGIALKILTSFAPLTLGESISVDGTCLTVTAHESQSFWCELSPETLQKTIARSYQKGSRVNLEQALRVGDRMGGHWVSGHVDCTLELTEKKVFEDFWKLTFGGFEKAARAYLLEKGSVALNGVSLTVNEVTDHTLSVMVIPHTLERTTLKGMEVKDRVNVEFDWMAKLIVQTVEKSLAGRL